MSRSTYGGPKLPKDLLEKVSDGRIGKRNHQQTRKEKRKAERTDKKRQTHSRPSVEERKAHAIRHDDRPILKPYKPPTRTAEATRKSAPKKPVEVSESEDGDDFGDFDGEESDDGSEDEEEEEDDYPIAAKVPSAVRAKLDDDDAEIRALEKKLGMRGKSKKKVGDEELDWLVGGGLSSEDEDGFPISGKKRAAPEDEDWLKQKRRKAETKKKVTKPVEVEVESEDESATSDDDPFAAFESGEEDEIDDGSDEEMI